MPGEGKDVGPTLGMNKKILQGLFFAPSVVASSLKTAILTAKVLEKLGYKVDPKWDEKRTDIVQTISFGDREKLIKYVQGIQMGSPVDSSSLPIPGDMRTIKTTIYCIPTRWANLWIWKTWTNKSCK